MSDHFWRKTSTKNRLKKAKTEGFTHTRDKSDEKRFFVCGLTNEYRVDLDFVDIMQSYCTCPDHTMNHNICKHIIYMYISECGDPHTVVSKSNNDCCICLDILCGKAVVVCCGCRNEFHSECISKWNRNCPLCREPL